MPVWAAIAVPAVGFAWAAWLIMNWLDTLIRRRHASESFMEWMTEERNRDA